MIKSDQLSLIEATNYCDQLYNTALLISSRIKTYKYLNLFFLSIVGFLEASFKHFFSSVEVYINYGKLYVGTALEVGCLNKLLYALYKKSFTTQTHCAKKVIYLSSRYLKTITITCFLLVCTCVPLLLMKKLDPYSPDHSCLYANHLYTLASATNKKEIYSC